MNPHARLGNTFLKAHPREAARILEDYPADKVAQLLASLGPGIAAGVLEVFSPGFAASSLALLEPSSAARVIEEVHPDLQIGLLRQLDAPCRETLLAELQPEFALSLRRMLPYPENTAGALMQAPLLSVPEDLTVRAALKRARRARREMKIYIYVTDTQGRLRGVLTLHELLNAPSGRAVAEVMHRPVVSLPADESMHSVIKNPYWQAYHALPVTDAKDILLGVIRQKSIHRHLDRRDHAEDIKTNLGMFVSVGDMFALAAGQLLADLIAACTSQTQGDSRREGRTDGSL